MNKYIKTLLCLISLISLNACVTTESNKEKLDNQKNLNIEIEKTKNDNQLNNLTLKSQKELPKLPKGVVVLMYHHISKNGPQSTSINPDTLKKQINFIKNNSNKYEVVDKTRALEIVSKLSEGEDFDKNKIAILFTVDDGWKNATLLNDLLYSNKWHGVLFMVSKMKNSGCCLTDLQLKKLNDEALSIENHTQSHIAEKSIIGGQPLKIDILNAQTTIESVTGKAPTLFAYPYGIMSKNGTKTVESLQFDALFSTNEGLWNNKNQNNKVPRYNVSNGSGGFERALEIKK